MAFSSSTSAPRAPIVLFCDFGLPYTGQMKGRIVNVLGAAASDHPIIDLFHDVPAHDVRAGSVLLAAHAGDFPPGSVFVCVVDPGVGSKTRKPGAVFAGGRWFVGPLNGLFEHVLRRWPDGAMAFEITWRPKHLSASFHGRDLFSPIAAQIACNGVDTEGLVELNLDEIRHPEFTDDVAEVIYADDFGNLFTGVRWQSLDEDDTIEVLGWVLPRARTFSDVEPGTLFIYENAVGLVEIAANLANAQKILDIGPGTRLLINKV
ncbi:SAM-dependent chlorinase/fluorinase [Magnetovibrio sp.]|uniref:SAM hydrolase/SAM-dependent halogenase family protein n=1 Tax=Magnetovibrio sp. TaxID=2024836 RepID=UPI002F958569